MADNERFEPPEHSTPARSDEVEFKVFNPSKRTATELPETNNGESDVIETVESLSERIVLEMFTEFDSEAPVTMSSEL
jgi:hypothetical protein